MAPQTRRATGAAKALAAARALDELQAAAQLQQELEQASIDLPKRGRGRPPKKQPVIPVVAGSDSASSAPTPLTNTSDGEYSTPATSIAVTPAPAKSITSISASASESSGRPHRGRLTLELPDDPSDDDDDDVKDEKDDKAPLRLSDRTRVQRQRQPIPSDNEEMADEYNELYGEDDQSADAALARQLQREEDQKVSTTSLSIPIKRKRASEPSIVDEPESDLTSRLSRPRLKKMLSARSPDSDSESAVTDLPKRPRKRQKKSAPKAAVRRRSPLISDVKKEEDDDDDDGDDEINDQELNSGSDEEDYDNNSEVSDFSAHEAGNPGPVRAAPVRRPRGDTGPVRGSNERRGGRRARNDRYKLEENHPELRTMWIELENMPDLNAGIATQPSMISLQLKPFQLQGLAWMKAMEQTAWKGGLLGDEMGLGKTIQAVSLIMSDYPAKMPTLVLLPPVALGQWQDEIATYTGDRLKTIVFHGTNAKAKNLKVKELKKFDVIIMSYNSLESLYRKQEKGVKRKEGLYKEKSVIHQIKFHRVILDEAHCIKTRTTMTARACFALNVEYRWCLTGTPLQNRIGEFFSLIRFLEVAPYASYFCKDCPCSTLEWSMSEESKCTKCDHYSMRHVSVFNQELLNPIQKYGNMGSGKEAFRKLRLLTNRIMLRRLKKDHTNVMELPVKEIHVDRQFFGEEENDFAGSIMSNTKRQFNTYVAQGVMLNNYANIFGLIMQMRQVADHPDLILKKSGEGGQNILVCCICDEPAEEAIRSKCKHDFCRQCAASYLASQDEPDCPRCHIPLSIDLEQPGIEQDETLVKKSSIINRIKMENWTSSSKIELLVHELHRLRSDNASHKSIIFSQFTTMLQLIEWRLRRAGITTVMLDGSMTPAQRQASIKHFMEKPEVECFLVSLKAGGVALNLTEASQVFIVDPWWNPAAEWQSADRCHRIGQTRPCTITRLCIEDSVESRMVLLQEKKTHMIHSTINSDDAAIESLTAADLSFLFRGS
ncbi:SNF2 family N-terminal domain-containing protein [Xylaria flabelliformis]|nr:SNF2 family N-terminal domain-containing protein [Xylaria flabelliformis]